MCAMPRDGGRRRACRRRSAARPRVACEAWSWNSVSLGSTSCTCAASTPSMPSIVRAISPSSARWYFDLLLEVGRAEAEARHVGEAGVAARA